MDILKSEYLSLTGQPLDWQGKMYHALTVGFGFSLADGTPLKAEKAWGAAMEGLASGFCVDSGVPKKQAEWLLSGAVCAPQNPGEARPQPVRGLVACCVVGSSRREWLATGEPKGSEMTPFTAMPLTWANTWGSPNASDNPLGCGLEPDAKGVLRTPTITEKDAASRRAACPGPLGPWPCRMKNMGTYNTAWLQQRWPGVPDDFDWTFFNLAQPEQRLPDGLKGGERLELTHLHPTAHHLALEAPSHQIQVDILRTGETEWKTLSAIRDTLWLFPGQLTGLYLWHALAPCKDEAASDIAVVRLTLTPEIVVEAAQEVPGVLGAAAGVAGAAADVAGDVSGAAVAGVAAVAVGAVGLGATLLARADSPGKTTKGKAAAPLIASSPASPPATPSATSPTTVQAVPPQTVSPKTASETAVDAVTAVSDTAMSPSAYMAEVATTALADLEASLHEINEGLRQAGLPPLTPAQIQETQERIVTATTDVGKLLSTPEPQLADVLRQAGLPEERIAAVNAVLELPVPSPADYADATAWNAATEVFVAQFVALMQPTDNVLENLRKGFSFNGPEGQSSIKSAFGPQPSEDEILARTGIEPHLLQAELKKLEQETLPGLNDMVGVSARAAELERALGLPPESMTHRINQFTQFMHQYDLLPPQITPLAATGEAAVGATAGMATSVEAQQASPEPNGTPLQSSESSPKATRADAAPKNRDDILMLLAVGAPLVGLIFSGMYLEEMDFSNQDLRGAQFDNARLTGADFSGADVTGGSFVGAELSNADFTGTTLTRADFSGASAVDATFTGAVLTGAALTGANLYGADFGHATMTEVDAAGCVLNRASFESTDLGGGNFSKASFHRADFHAARAERAVFTQADMTDASLGFGTTVAGADFCGACLKGGAWDGVTARGGNFTGVKADTAAFVDCDFSTASWKATRAREANFSRSTFHKADLRGADLFKASLREADVETADFSDANLYNADLYRLRTSPITRLDGTDITATILEARKIPC